MLASLMFMALWSVLECFGGWLAGRRVQVSQPMHRLEVDAEKIAADMRAEPFADLTPPSQDQEVELGVGIGSKAKTEMALQRALQQS